MTEVLILGGTTEARRLCDAIADLPVTTLVSLAGVTRQPVEVTVPVRTGGFGGATGLIGWLQENRTQALVDATHPFAARMPWNAQAACAQARVPRLRILRPAFQNIEADRVSELSNAIDRIASGKRVLLTSGQSSAKVLHRRTDLVVFLRSIEPVENLPANVRPLLMRPPFSQAAERALLQQHRIDVLIAKDSGGITAPKLHAAQALGIQTILIRRPEQPPGPTVQTVEQAVAWLRHVVGIGT